MAHTRLNQKVEAPNPYINFITALPGPSQDDALGLLRALAAQLKPIMKTNGFIVNSLEEYECNKVFLGRNWNAGETIELVLRREDGRFWPMSHLIAVFCHELSHNKHMNHLPAFHKLRLKLQDDVQVLRNRNYFGDGMYSAGHRLSDSKLVPPSMVTQEDLPDFICGGAQEQSRSQVIKRRRRRKEDPTPSLHTGAQTAKKRKAGGRVRSAYAFGGPNAIGRTIGESIQEESEKKKGSGFRKQAGSRTAREQRAAAAERRTQQLRGLEYSTPVEEQKLQADNGSDDDGKTDMEDEDDFEIIPETDIERLQRAGINSAQGQQEKLLDGNDFAVSSTLLDGPTSSSRLVVTAKIPAETLSAAHLEIDLRKKEALGLNNRRTLGESLSSTHPASIPPESKNTNPDRSEPEHWSCAACTLLNHPDYALCAVCGTRKEET